MSEFFTDLYEILRPQLLGHGLVFLLYALVFILAKPVLNFFNRGKDVSFQIRAMRVGIVVIFLLHLFDVFIIMVSARTGDDNAQHIFINLGYSIAAIYAGLFVVNVISYFSRKKFGLEKKVEGDIVYMDTYNSRLFDIAAYVGIFFLWMYAIILIWGLESWLETTGFIGITLGFLALTNSIWMPDIYYGLVILNSKMLEDGDVIKFNQHPNENIISRITFIYTILLDVRNNHRLLVRNSQLVGNRVDNLTKRASIDGLRHSMTFNIGYPRRHTEIDNGEGFKEYHQRVERMFEKAFEIASDNKECKINSNSSFEVALVESADYALKYTLSYYLEAIPNTKVTKTIRQYLVRTPAIIQQAINSAALEEGIQLATPVLVDHKSLDLKV